MFGLADKFIPLLIVRWR